jgi:hypothetical protein
MLSVIRRLSAIVFLSLLVTNIQAQPDSFPDKSKEDKTNKPYKVQTSGKQITINSTKTIKHVMLWTSRGNRVVEQKEINSGTCSFTVPVSDKFFFLMIGMVSGKIYTEKIGVR